MFYLHFIADDFVLLLFGPGLADALHKIEKLFAEITRRHACVLRVVY